MAFVGRDEGDKQVVFGAIISGVVFGIGLVGHRHRAVDGLDRMLCGGIDKVVDLPAGGCGGGGHGLGLSVEGEGLHDGVDLGA